MWTVVNNRPEMWAPVHLSSKKLIMESEKSEKLMVFSIFQTYKSLSAAFQSELSTVRMTKGKTGHSSREWHYTGISCIIKLSGERKKKVLKHTAEELNKLSKDEVIDLMLSMEEKYDKKLDYLYEQIRLANSRQFGRKSEKNLLEDDGQLTLACVLNEAEALLDSCFLVPEPAPEDVVPDVIVRRKPKQKGKRAEDLKGLEAEDIDHRLSEEELAELFPNGYKELPTEDYLRLKMIPAKFVAERHHLHIYADKKSDTIVRADHPADLLRNSIVSAPLESAIINAKFVNQVPYDRLSKEFERNGVHISSTNMASWTIKCAEMYFQTLYDAARKKLLEAGVIQADETPVLVSKDGRPAGSKSYMWVYRTGCREDGPPVILYEYQKTRNASHPGEFLEGYSGTCVTDGYQVYQTLGKRKESLTIAGCWAHTRRKFTDAVKALDKSVDPKGTVAYKAIALIGAIYKLDNALKGLPDDELLARRKKEVAPLVDAFFAWVKEKSLEVSNKSKTGEGLGYAINQEAYLRVFLENPRVPLDNNATEQSIRPFCVGKHNWHLIDTIRGAKASAMIYSLVETVKANNLKPYDYFSYVLTEMPKTPKDLRASQVERFMPWSPEIPENCFIKK